MTIPRARARARARRIVAALACAGLFLTLLASPASADRAAATSAPASEGAERSSSHAGTVVNTMTFNGRGWGHGRGLSQYGAQGYATVHGWTSKQILDHYYGGTTSGNAATASNLPVNLEAVRIRLMAQDGKPTVVAISNGTLGLTGTGGVAYPTDLTAVRLTATENDGLLIEQAATCAGPWSPVGADGLSRDNQITVARTSGTEQLQLCRADGTTVWYPGTLRAHLHDTGTGLVQRTINITSIEAQLRSVVPRESPATWSDAALQAQAVAARSYALAGDNRHLPYADTCDTILCQVYAGHAQRKAGETEKTATTHPNTDKAIAATAGIVRLNAANQIARTEFSSTSGGWTAGGTFPAVEDLGDSISPLHTWTRSTAVTALETSYGEKGSLVEIEVLKRNGLGADGGRVTKARLHFSNGITKDVSGNTVRSKIRLLSDWFTPTCPTETRYLNAVYQLFVKRPATSDEIETWCGPVRRGERLGLTTALSVSDEWAGVQIEQLYERILGRPAEDDGKAFWLREVENGLRIEDIAAEFYGSKEFYSSVGATTVDYVDELYLDLLGRPADDDGRTFWVKVLDGKTMTRTEAAEEFYASIESRSDRVDELYQVVLGRGAEPDGRSFWAGQLETLGDVALAAQLAASDEYFTKATKAASST